MMVWGSFALGQDEVDLPSVVYSLRNPVVLSELDVSDEQAFSIEKAFKEAHEERQKKLDEFRQLKLSPEERRDALTEMQDELAKLAMTNAKKVFEVLVPAQRERLEQIRFQLKFKLASKRAGSTGLANPEIRELLGISESQALRIEKLAITKHKDLERKIAELRSEIQRELLDELTDKQREKFDDLFGEPIKGDLETSGIRLKGGGLGKK